MTVHFYIHWIMKRAKAIALLDSGATENFMNLSYAKWLKLPIKRLDKPRKLFNVDGTKNKSGELLFFTDLQVQTGEQNVALQFFLSDLGEHKAILGCPWFAAMQPKIDWKRGWIDHTQLPIVLKADNAKQARFTPRTRNVPQTIHRDQYFIGRVTFGQTNQTTEQIPSLPKEYQRHHKIFTKQELQRLLGHTIWDHAIELLPGAPTTLPG